MATHFKGPLIVEQSGSTIPGLLADGTADSLDITNDGAIGGDLDVGGALSVGGGSSVKAVKSGTVSVNPGALAAGAETDISVTIPGAAAGDIVQFMPTDAAAETGLAVVLVWVSAANTVKIRVSNMNAVVALTGGAANWTYIHTDLT